MNRSIRGFNQENIQDMNRTLLLNFLRKKGIYARAHLTNLSQLKQATVTGIVGDFIDWDLIEEVRFLIRNRGCRSINISINDDNLGVLAIRLARKNYAVSIFNPSGRFLDKERVGLDMSQPPRVAFEAIIHEARELIRSSKSRKIITIDMAIPSPYSEERGRIELMTGVLGWNEIPIREKLQDIFKIPVFLKQDANASALTQYRHSDGDYKNGVVVYIAVGRGIGTGIINNGELLKGCIGVAGEVGHTSTCYNEPRRAYGNYGRLKNYCSSIVFTKEANRVLKPEMGYNFRQVSQLLRGEDQVVTGIFLGACDRLSVGIVNIINSFSPSVIVIGDEMSHILPSAMSEGAKNNVRERMLPRIYVNMNITISVVSSDSMAHGTATVTINGIFNHPLTYFGSNRRDDQIRRVKTIHEKGYGL